MAIQIPDIDSIIGRAADVHEALGPQNTPVTPEVLNGLQYAKDLYKQLNSGKLDSAQHSDTMQKYMEVRQLLDQVVTRGEVQQKDNHGLHQMKVGAAGLAAAIPRGAAGMADFADLAVSRITGTPQADSMLAYVNSKLPVAVNPQESVTENAATLFGGAVQGAKDIPAYVRNIIAGLSGDTAAKGTSLVTKDPLAIGAAGLAGGMLGGSAAGFTDLKRRDVARQAAGELTDADLRQIDTGTAEAQQHGINPTPAQTGPTSNPAFRNLQGAENDVASMPSSKVAAKQGAQHNNLRLDRATGDATGTVRSTESLAEAGRGIAKGIKDAANEEKQAVYDEALNASGPIPEEQMRRLSRALRDTRDSPAVQADGDFSSKLNRLRNNLLYTQERARYRMGENGPELISPEVRSYHSDPSIVKNIELSAKKPVTKKDSSTSSREIGLDKYQGRVVGGLFKNNIEAINRADTAQRDWMRDTDYNRRYGKNGLGAWIPTQADAKAPVAAVNQLLQNKVLPNMSDAENPVMRFYDQIRGHEGAPQFFADAYRTYMDQQLKKIPTGEQASPDIATQLKRTLNDPAAHATRQSLIRARVLAEGGTHQDAVQAARGAESLLRTADMLERRAAGSIQPSRAKGTSAEDSGIEMASTLMGNSITRQAHVTQKFLRGNISARTLRWLDENLTTPEGVRFLKEYGKQNWKTDAAKGLFQGAIMQQDFQPIEWKPENK